MKWWEMNRHRLPPFARVFHVVLTHIPNSCAPEAVFSILNDTFTEDQKKAKGDYMELALLLQYNARGREKLWVTTGQVGNTVDKRPYSQFCSSHGNEVYCAADRKGYFNYYAADAKQLFNYCGIDFGLCGAINCQLLRAFHPINAIPLLCKSKPLFGTPLIML